MPTPLASTVSDLRARVDFFRAAGKRIVLVPTMGALHAGHMSLMREARKHGDVVIAYIFVNPKQFGPNEDLAKYPRTLEADMALLSKEGVDLCYAPPVEDVYPEGFITEVHLPGLENIHTGKFRPVFFSGIATVLTKMFNRIRPDVAIFGEKDYQQLIVIRTFVRDLEIPVEIVGGATVREVDGLALASRNVYLSAEERKLAPALYAVMNRIAERVKQQPDAVEAALEAGKKELLDSGFASIDYITLVHPETLAPQAVYTAPARLLAAAWLGTTRLIDNISVE